MTPPKVALIDYGMGNLRSVAKALEKVGCAVRWADRPSQLKGCDVMVLPGVGAFSLAVKNLKERKLFVPVQEWIARQKPFLGICLGYQLLFEESEETRNGDGKVKGLAVFKGRVKKFKVNKNLKVPHMGWNRISQKQEVRSKKSEVFKGIPEGAYFYFVHSFFPAPEDRKLAATTTSYGERFVSSVSQRNLFASQFHPEKSGANGLKLIRNFFQSVC